MRAAAVMLHVALIAAVAAAAATLPAAGSVRAGIAVIGLLPALAALPGLIAANRATQLWWSVALIVYIGVAATEIVAAAGRFRPPALVLLIALAELAALLSLSRRRPAARHE